MQINTQQNVPFFTKFLTFLLLLSGILQTYLLAFDKSVADVLSILAVIIFVILYKKINYKEVPKYFNLFFIALGISIILHVFIEGPKALSSVLNLSFRYLLYTMLFLAIDFDYLVKWYKRIAIICIAFFFIQEIMFYTTGMRILGVITSLPLTISHTVDNIDTWASGVELGKRSSSFFSEPAHFAQFLIPLLIIELFYDKKKNHYLFAALIFLVLLLLQSGNALLCSVPVVLMFFFKLLKGKKIINMLLVLLFVIIGAFTMSYYLSLDAGQNVMERQDEMKNTSFSASSGFVRIYRGWYVIDELDTFDKFVGVNYEESIQQYIQQSKVYWAFGKNDLYFNTIQNVVLRTGYIGSLIFLLMLCNLWRRNSRAGKTTLLSLLVMSFISANYFTMTMAIYMVVIYKLQRKNISEHNNKILLNQNTQV